MTEMGVPRIPDYARTLLKPQGYVGRDGFKEMRLPTQEEVPLQEWEVSYLKMINEMRKFETGPRAVAAGADNPVFKNDMTRFSGSTRAS